MRLYSRAPQRSLEATPVPLFQHRTDSDVGRNRFAVGFLRRGDPGLKQPWAVGRNRFAVTKGTKI
jgi:hypothetical protein